MLNGSRHIQLNIGCGKEKIKDFINLDFEKSVKPDIICNISRAFLPFKSESVDFILFSHTVEHIEEIYHLHIFSEFYRVLKPGAVIIISYPEFSEITKNYLSNHKGMREFWKATIYGRQTYKSDYHVSLMDSTIFLPFLQKMGFSNIIRTQETGFDYNTLIKAEKGKFIRREDVIRNEIWKT